MSGTCPTCDSDKREVRGQLMSSKLSEPYGVPCGDNWHDTLMDTPPDAPAEGAVWNGETWVSSDAIAIENDLPSDPTTPQDVTALRNAVRLHCYLYDNLMCSPSTGYKHPSCLRSGTSYCERAIQRAAACDRIKAALTQSRDAERVALDWDMMAADYAKCNRDENIPCEECSCYRVGVCLAVIGTKLDKLAALNPTGGDDAL